MIKRKIIGILSLAVFSSVAVLTGIANAGTPTQDKKATWEAKKIEKEDYIKAHPALANDLKALKNLPKDQRKAKFEELSNKYPEFFQKFKHGGKNRMGRGGKLMELAKNNPALANDLKALKNLTKEEKKAKFEELKKKYNLPDKK